MKRKYRIFVAINLPKEIKKELSGYQKKWQGIPARWTKEDNMHITLEFLGYLTDEELGTTCSIVKEIAERHNSFTVNLNKILYWPVNKSSFSNQGVGAKMIWAKGENSKELSLLKQDLQKSLSGGLGFNPEKRVFSPHITLARIKEWEWKKIDLEERPEIAEDINLSFSVESIEVMESNLRSNGAEYSIFESHSLRD